MRNADSRSTMRSRAPRGGPSIWLICTAQAPLVLTQALTRGRRIVKWDSGVLARLLVKMWYLNADLMPLVRMIQDTRRQRFLHG